MARYFETANARLRAKPELRSHCRFEVADLLRMHPPAAHYDLVMCRNTVIHFDQATRDKVHAMLAASLRAGGYLMDGAAERVGNPLAGCAQRTCSYSGNDEASRGCVR